MSITISGSDRLKRKFGQLGAIAKGQMLERALVAGALPIQNEAKRLAPIETGNLRRSIHIGGHEDLNPGGQGIVDTGGSGLPGPEIGPHDASVYVGTNVVYASAQEFGTTRIPAHPYLRPAFDTQRTAAVREVGEVLRELIQVAVR